MGDDSLMGTRGRDRTWRCATCGDAHRGLVTVFGPSSPDPWASATAGQRAAGGINADTCVLTIDDDTFYFIRGEIPIDIVDSDSDDFAWAVWVSLSEQNMQRLAGVWDQPERVELPPMFAWLSNELSVYERSTTNLAVNVHQREPGIAPWIELDPADDHPMVHEQREGITLHHLAELNRLLLGG